MAISAQDIKELNKMTGAGMMDCKKALVEANGNVEEAAKELMKKGLAAAAKRSERATSEGRVFIRQEGNKIAVAGLTCETDFVSKNDDFIATGDKIAETILAKGYTEVVDELTKPVDDLKTRIRENMVLSTVKLIEVPENASVGIYVHSDFKTAGVTIVKGSTDDKVKEFARDCCMHLAAYTPAYVKASDVPESYINDQKEIFLSQMDQDPKMASKPQNVKEGILQGKIKKHLADICFVDQAFVKDDKFTVAAKLAEIGKEVGATLEFGEIQLVVLGK